jgi:hypothetical protein
VAGAPAGCVVSGVRSLRSPRSARSGRSVNDLAFSSFIMGEGALTASSTCTMRWRSTASLNLKPFSSSSMVAWLHSMFIST